MRRVTLVGEAIPHHGGHSGYARSLGVALGGSGQAAWVRRNGPAPMVGRWANRLVRPPGAEWYTLAMLGRELVALARLSRPGPQVCHFLSEVDYHYLGNLRRRMRGPGRIVVTFHQPPEVLERVLADRAPLDAIDVGVVLCEQQAAHLRAREVQPRRVEVIPHFVDADFFSPAPAATGEPPQLICVGSHLRDFHTLGAVARRLRERAPQVRLLVVADERARAPLHDETNVILHRGISDEELRESYRRSYALLLPLQAATANNALLEALASGLPVVVSDVGGVREYVREPGAQLIGAGDAEGMCDAALRLLGDRALRARLGAANRRRAETLRAEHTVAPLRALYASLLDEQRLTARARVH